MRAGGLESKTGLQPPAGEMTEAVRVWLLGGFRVSIGSRTIEEGAWRLRKAAALVKLLALAPGHRLHREQVMDVLWPDLGRKAASNNLRRILHTARRVFDPVVGSHYLVSEDESLVLCPGDDLWVDVEALEEVTATGRRSRDPGAYRAAIELYSGELLPGDRYEEWAEGRRQELRHTWLSLHLELARVYEERGEYEKGIEALQRAVLEEPTNEQMHATLMRLYAFAERRGDALAQYERLQEALSGELDAEVSATTERLREELAAGTFLPAQSTVAQTEEPSDTGRHNLPASRTTFVGREHEMMEIKRHLAMTRLLTLTGAGGSGKTRLALEVARDLIGAYPDGVWLVQLASLSQGEFVAKALAEAVGVPGQPSRLLTDTLVDALRAKRMLLILDNREHLVDAVGELAALLLDSCPHLRILATSREALGAVGEVVWPLSLLSVPDLRSVPTVADLEGYEAIRLFLDRARQRKPAFALRPDNAQAIAQICVRLEGLPLAIELAAARIKILSLQALLDRLKERLKLLTSGPSELSERQRTLRNTIEWSYELLEEGEKALFSRLSVFAGGATLEAIERVCDALGDLSVDPLEDTSSLLEKSLLVQEEGAEREPRFMMLETIREYARERLEESGEAEARIKTLAGVGWLADAQGDLDRAEVAAEEGLKLSTQAGISSDYAADIKSLLGELASIQGDHEQAARLIEESLALYQEAGDKPRIARALGSLANVSGDQGDHERAKELYAEGLALSREIGGARPLGKFLIDLGYGYLLEGDLERATELNEEAADLFRKQGRRGGLQLALDNLGWAAILRGKYDKARTLHKDSLILCKELGDRTITSQSLEGLACSAGAKGDPERAARLFGAAEALREAVGSQQSPRQSALREPFLRAARSRLAEAAWEKAFMEGRTLGLEEAVEYALSEEEHATPTAQALDPSIVCTQESALTRREQEIAALVAQGMTNRQIAAELVISEHTTATHVRRILKKLNLQSRSQIGSWLIERRSPTADLN